MHYIVPPVEWLCAQPEESARNIGRGDGGECWSLGHCGEDSSPVAGAPGPGAAGPQWRFHSSLPSSESVRPHGEDGVTSSVRVLLCLTVRFLSQNGEAGLASPL